MGFMKEWCETATAWFEERGIYLNPCEGGIDLERMALNRDKNVSVKTKIGKYEGEQIYKADARVSQKFQPHPLTKQEEQIGEFLNKTLGPPEKYKEFGRLNIPKAIMTPKEKEFVRTMQKKGYIVSYPIYRSRIEIRKAWMLYYWLQFLEKLGFEIALQDYAPDYYISRKENLLKDEVDE